MPGFVWVDLPTTVMSPWQTTSLFSSTVRLPQTTLFSIQRALTLPQVQKISLDASPGKTLSARLKTVMHLGICLITCSLRCTAVQPLPSSLVLSGWLSTIHSKLHYIAGSFQLLQTHATARDSILAWVGSLTQIGTCSVHLILTAVLRCFESTG